MENTAIGTAIGKIILIGEHSVVYGQPAIAIPFTKTSVKTIISSGNGPVKLDCFYHKGSIFTAPKELLGLTTVIKEVINSFNEKLEDFNIKIESSIPPERGMGSSAAVAAATVRALFKFFNQELKKEELIKWTNISEKIVHGNPSGIDTALVVDERPLYFIKDKPLIPFIFRLKAYLIVADTGKPSKTQKAVANVRDFINTRPREGKEIINNLGLLTKEARSLIVKEGLEKLGQVMTKAHKLLDQLGISNRDLNNLVSTALDNQALGAKLTGGGQGGCMIALASTKDQAMGLANKLMESGAKNTWIYNMGVD